jgi:serine/threonine protein kinase
MSTSKALILDQFKKFLENQSEHDITFTSNGYMKRNSDYKIKFEKLSKLSEGTFGQVFKVRVKKDFINEFEESEIHVIKKVGIIHTKQFKLCETFSDFLTLISFKNERIVKCFDPWFEIDNHLNELSLFVRTELCDGNLKTIIELIQNNPRVKGKHCLTLSGYCLASDISIEILEAVNYLHKRNPTLIHGNLKPENILFKRYNNSMFIKIADSGLRSFEEFSLRKQGIKRNDGYLAPEVMNNKGFGTKSDIYSLGIMTKELFHIDFEKLFLSFFIV